MSTARDLAMYGKPLGRDYLSVDYFEEKIPVVSAEAYIYRGEDLVALNPVREAAVLDRIFESTK